MALEYSIVNLIILENKGNKLIQQIENDKKINFTH